MRRKIAIALVLLAAIGMFGGLSIAAKISEYLTDDAPDGADYLLGVDTDDTTQGAAGTTKKYAMSTLPISVPVQSALDAKQNADGAVDPDNISGDDTDDDQLDGEQVSPAALQSVTVADSGDGNAATGTVTPTVNIALHQISLTCSDADGCSMTMSETGAIAGAVVTITNIGANAATFADTGGVQELVAACTLAQYETLTLQYKADRWVEVSRATNTIQISAIETGVNASDGTYSGTFISRTVDSGASASAFGQAYHIDTDGELIPADADVAAAAAMPVFCLAVESGTGSKRCLIEGTVTEADWNWTVGGLIYAGDAPATTSGLTQTAPATTGDQVQVLGVALSADTIFFKPALVLVEVP
jgi:hypothetical protein